MYRVAPPTSADAMTLTTTDDRRRIRRPPLAADPQPVRERRHAESGFESRSADVLAQYLGDTGLDLERYTARPGRENLVARIEGSDPTAPTLLLMGHTDVVPVNDDGWQRDPFGGELVDGEVWGRGAVDMLNLTATMAVAFRNLARSGFTPRGTLVYLAVADEENLGTWGAEHLLQHERDAVMADYVVTEAGGFQMPSADGPAPAGDRRREGLVLVPHLGAGTPGHASQPFRTDNALVTAAEVVRRLAEYRPPTMIHDTWRRFIEGVDFGPEWNAKLARRRRRCTTSARSCRSASRARRTRARTRRSRRRSSHGGTKTNVIPDLVEIEVDIRTLPGPACGRRPQAARRRARRSRGARRDHAVRRERVDRVTDRHADVGRDGARVVAPRRRLVARAVPHRRRDRRAVLPARGLGRVRLRPVQPAALVRGLRVDVPRQRRTRRRRVARALHPALGSPRPRPP